MPTSWWVCGLLLLPAFSAAVYVLCVDSARMPPAALAAICIAMPTIVMALFVLNRNGKMHRKMDDKIQGASNPGIDLLVCVIIMAIAISGGRRQRQP